MKRPLLLIAGVAVLVVAVVVLMGTVIAAPTIATQLSGGVRPESLQEGQLLRTYRVYTPSSLDSHPGLIVVLQPAGGSAGVMEVVTGLDREADRLNWLVVYADSARVWSNGWDPFTCCGVNQDVAFISTLIDKMEQEHGVDPARVYVTGWSRGAMMTYRVGCELSSKVAAIAPVDGSMADMRGDVRGANCHPERPVSVLSINGSADPQCTDRRWT
jgi:polyhydroxybutyrate depolymerase